MIIVHLPDAATLRITHGVGYEMNADGSLIIHAADATVAVATVAPGMWIAVEIEQPPE